MALVQGTNSYVTNAQADTYFTDSLRDSEWSALTETTQDAALVEATRYLERLSWEGTKTGGSGQILAWPRDSVTNSEGEDVSGTIPPEIEEAQYEVAIRLAADPTLIDSISQQGSSNIKRVKADTAEVEFFSAIQGGQLFDWVQTLVKSFLSSSNISGGIGGASSSGTDDESFFTTGSEKYGKSKGFA